MKYKLKEYFSFTKRERNGTLILVALIIMLFVANKTTHLFFPDKDHNYTEFETEVDKFLAGLEEIEEGTYVSRLDKYIIARYDTLDLFMFDPNTTTNEEWLLLGLTKKQISTINTYIERGGSFKIKDDFRKIYGIRTKQYQILKPFIDLPTKNNNSYNKYSNNYKNNYNKNKDFDFSPDSLFEFNPNNTSLTEWQLLGMSEKQISTINNYLSKGGKFYNKEGFSKIYGISPEQFKILEPYIKIENKNNKQKNDIKLNIELNSASKEELIGLSGIGNYYAERIIKYRDLLHGFNKKEQLLEVYGFKEETYEKIKNQVYVNQSSIKKIRINFVSLYELSKHPYIDKNTAKKILDYRNKNGAYTNIQQLISNNIISEKIFQKIKYYITVE